ncbi:MAG: hypothetical protein IT258_24470 [Saprospiraceae bacterium]|nr:hypothetical protein [Saprospiraceae bacterium]
MAKSTPVSALPDQATIEAQLRQQLENNPKVKSWFEKYRNYSWDSFIKQYAYSKHSALLYPDLYIDDFKPANKEFNALARQALEAIQQKKLFNLQCEWRAGSIELPFVKITYDFELIGRKLLMECPFLPPVTFDEVELFIQYLHSSHSEDLDMYDMYYWQNYDDIKNEYETDEFGITPSWYEFYDGMRGTGYLIKLPNTRGEKESEYAKIGWKDANPNPTPYIPNPEMDKPYPDHEAEIDFALCFETPELAEAIISHVKKRRQRSNHEELDGLYDYLKSIPETISFVPHHDWRESLRLTIKSYRNAKIAEALPRIWRQYIRPFGNDPEAYVRKRIAEADFDLSKQDDYGLRARLVEEVLKGRELSGEPRNFDY